MGLAGKLSLKCYIPDRLGLLVAWSLQCEYYYFGVWICTLVVSHAELLNSHNWRKSIFCCTSVLHLAILTPCMQHDCYV